MALVGMKLFVKRSQVMQALQRLDALLAASRTPMARFLTSRDGWVLEVEHLEKNGEARLRELLAAADEGPHGLGFELDGLTGHHSGRQHHVRNLRNGTYVREITVRNRSALNVF